MLTSIATLYILYTIGAPTWCYIITCVSIALSLVTAGVRVAKAAK